MNLLFTNDNYDYAIMFTTVKNFITWLQPELDKRGWTRADLARKAGVNQSTLSMIYSGQRKPGHNLLAAIAFALKVPLEVVYRAAALLPAEGTKDYLIEQIIHLTVQLPEQDQQEILDYARMRVQVAERRGKHETGKKTQKSPATTG